VGPAAQQMIASLPYIFSLPYTSGITLANMLKCIGNPLIKNYEGKRELGELESTDELL
jgi:hypothetical protein